MFRKYFTAPLAKIYHRRPEKIANRVYANRMGNGNEASGDGWKYRGRGFIQLTGKNNYKAFSEYIGEDCVSFPELVAVKYPMTSAFWFFTENKIWDIAAKGDTYSIVKMVTKRVNGGYHGIGGRWKKFTAYLKILDA